MSSMKNVYSAVQELLLAGNSIATVATELDLPASLVREIRSDMLEYSDEFVGNQLA